MHSTQPMPMLGRAEELATLSSALDAIPFVEHAARVRRQLADALTNIGDVDAAILELRRIHEVFAKIGAKPALDDVRNKLRELGARPPSRAPGVGVGALTEREVEITRFVAARKSNKEIGGALAISPRTEYAPLEDLFESRRGFERGAHGPRAHRGDRDCEKH